MTQPKEESIRAACEEAGLPRFVCDAFLFIPPEDSQLYSAILALARRIAAEREAVPVADTCQNCGNTLGISD